MEELKYDNYFASFIKMLKNQTVKINFSRNSFSISVRRNANIPEIAELKNFMSTIISELINNIISGSTSIKYQKYIEMLKLKNPELIEEIKIKLFSNMNTLSDFDFEVINSIPYNNQAINTGNTSVILKLEYDKPLKSKECQNSLTLELSKKNLQDLKNEISSILDFIG